MQTRSAVVVIGLMLKHTFTTIDWSCVFSFFRFCKEFDTFAQEICPVKFLPKECFVLEETSTAIPEYPSFSS